MAARFSRQGEVFEGLTKGGRWTGEVQFYPHELTKPVSWTRSRRIGVCFMGDLFHENANWKHQAAVFGAMIMAQQHKFLVLTKRPLGIHRFVGKFQNNSFRQELFEEMLIHPRMSSSHLCVEMAKRLTAESRFDHWKIGDKTFAPKNVWFGVSVENQKNADKRIQILAEAEGVQRTWVSVEPMIAPITLKSLLRYINFVVVGGESGPGYRPMELDWARRLRDECAEAQVPFFFKQTAGKNPIPDDLMVQQLPSELNITKSKEK